MLFPRIPYSLTLTHWMTDDEGDDEDYFVHSTPILSFKKETINSKKLLFLNECAPQRKFIRLLQMSIQKDKTAKEGTTFVSQRLWREIISGGKIGYSRLCQPAKSILQIFPAV